MRRSLTLVREALAPLPTEDLSVVAGGGATGGCPYTFRVRECLSIEYRCIDTLA